MRRSFLLAFTLALCFSARAAVEPEAWLTVQVDKPGHAVPPSLYGIFFEEINHSGDGGLYAELVNNRSFEDAADLRGWTLVKADSVTADATVQDAGAGSAGHALRVSVSGDGSASVRNDGYWGMNVRKGASYELNLIARRSDGFTGPLTARIQSATGATLAEVRTGDLQDDWKAFTLKMKASGSDPKASLLITGSGPGAWWIDYASLFPVDTFRKRANGMRPDLATMLDELHPAFMRFPGGCWVEGNTIPEAMRWKTTIGPLPERRTQYNLWQYMSGNGLGFHEYLQLAEDLKAEPLFVINCGMSHNGNVPMDKMGEFVQDALDAIEYANGDVTTSWGAKRAAAGHPAPFGLKYMEIGNENGGPAYAERFPLFVKAIKAKYPEMNLIADVWGGTPDSAPVEIIDEHYYSTPQFFINNAFKYDSYDRSGPKVYVGEYAVTQGCGQGNLAAALGEAAFMTGMERNSDIVTLASYAPLFANVNYKRWNPDTINFDSSRAYGTPSYYVQKLFSRNRADVILPTTVNAPVEVPAASASGAIGLGTWATQSEYKDVVVTQGGKTLFSSNFANGAGDWKPANGTWSVVDGAYRQTGTSEDCRTVAGDPAWTDYTLSVKARKISGDEGFLVLVRVHDSKNYVWWNVGGWGNTRDSIERCIDGGKNAEDSKPGSVETGRWYDLRVEVEGARIRCFRDGVLVHDVTQGASQGMFAVAGTSKANGDTIIKVVNVTDSPKDTLVKLDGAARVAARGMAQVLTSGDKADENTLDQPTKVAPVEQRVNDLKPEFRYTFPARSVTVLRVKATP